MERILLLPRQSSVLIGRRRSAHLLHICSPLNCKMYFSLWTVFIHFVFVQIVKCEFWLGSGSGHTSFTPRGTTGSLTFGFNLWKLTRRARTLTQDTSVRFTLSVPRGDKLNLLIWGGWMTYKPISSIHKTTIVFGSPNWDSTLLKLVQVVM